MTQRNQSSFTERFAVGKKLEDVCKKVDGHAVYEPGWDDAAVARATMPQYQGNGAGVVASVRREMFGRFLRVRRPNGRVALSADDEALIDDLRRLVGWLDRTNPGWRTLAEQNGQLQFPENRFRLRQEG